MGASQVNYADKISKVKNMISRLDQNLLQKKMFPEGLSASEEQVKTDILRLGSDLKILVNGLNISISQEQLKNLIIENAEQQRDELNNPLDAQILDVSQIWKNILQEFFLSTLSKDTKDTESKVANIINCLSKYFAQGFMLGNIYIEICRQLLDQQSDDFHPAAHSRERKTSLFLDLDKGQITVKESYPWINTESPSLEVFMKTTSSYTVGCADGNPKLQDGSMVILVSPPENSESSMQKDFAAERNLAPSDGTSTNSPISLIKLDPEHRNPLNNTGPNGGLHQLGAEGDLGAAGGCTVS